MPDAGVQRGALSPGLGLLAAAGLVYLALCVLLFIFQRQLLYFPQPARVAVETEWLLLADARLQLSVRPRPNAPALLYFGGNAEDVSASLAELAALFPEYALYLMHYRGFGGSSGRPSEAALHADALALFDQVQARHSQVLVLGRSLGSGVALRLASQRPVQRLLLVTPFDSIEALAVRQFPIFPVRWLLRDRFDVGVYAAQVSAPTVLIAAEHDEVIPRTSTELLWSRFAPGVARLHLIPGVGHNSIHRSPAYASALQ